MTATLRGASRKERAGFKRGGGADRKSTRLNSSHLVISYAVFCLKKKKKLKTIRTSSDSISPPRDRPTHAHSPPIVPYEGLHITARDRKSLSKATRHARTTADTTI